MVWILPYLSLLFSLQDNKVLPTEVSAIQARAEDHWWHDPKYIIHDVNVNSVIAHPAHDEVLNLGNETYTARGYAYSGGGKRVTRIEVSLDEGKTWLLTQIT
jgi:nitrate reductase (NAD(P)H)